MKHLLLTTIAAVVLVGCAKTPDISIHEAAELGNIEILKQHLDYGTDINAPALDLRKKRRNYNGNSPIFLPPLKK